MEKPNAYGKLPRNLGGFGQKKAQAWMAWAFGFGAWQFPTFTWQTATLSSALSGFTSEFGMGSGGSRSLWSPSNSVCRPKFWLFASVKLPSLPLFSSLCLLVLRPALRLTSSSLFRCRAGRFSTVACLSLSLPLTLWNSVLSLNRRRVNFLAQRFVSGFHQSLPAVLSATQAHWVL